MKLKQFIKQFLDGKTRVDLFDSYSTDEETIHYTGRIENLTRHPENYLTILETYVENIDVGHDGLLLILVNKEEPKYDW